MSSSSSNKMPMMVDRPATTSTLLTVASGQLFSTSLLPTAIGNVTKIFDVDSALTDTSISGAYIDEIWLRYSQLGNTTLSPYNTPYTGTYAVSSLTVTVTYAGHNLQVGQKIYLSYTSGGASGTGETITVSSVTPTTFTGTSTVAGSPSGNVTGQPPVDICFYLLSKSSATLLTDYLPFFVASVPSTADNQTFSLTENNILPLVNHPVAQAGANFTSANSKTSPKLRGLMLQRGQSLYAAVSGASALSNGYYVNVQAGYY